MYKFEQAGRIAMTKVVKDMAPFCTIYDVNFRNLQEENRLCIEEGLSGNGNFVLADPPYSVQRGSKIRSGVE